MREGREGADPRDLRAAWEALLPPEPPDELDELARREPETARAVELVRGLWARLEAPAVERFAPPLPVPVRRWSARRLVPWLCAAAAAVLALVAVDLERRRGEAPHDVEHTATLGSRPQPAPRAPAATDGAPAPAAPIVAMDDQRIEMQSGPVRLILLRR